MSLNFREELYSFFIANSLITTRDANRILLFPQSSGPKTFLVPVITIEEITNTFDADMEGDAGQTHPVMQIGIFFKTQRRAIELARTVQALLHGFKGSIGGTRVNGAFIINRRENYEIEAKLYRVDLDIRFAVCPN